MDDCPYPVTADTSRCDWFRLTLSILRTLPGSWVLESKLIVSTANPPSLFP
nr:MAG TPA: hypothetical protein [Caudoviricetes sp.]